MQTIKHVDTTNIERSDFSAHLADCVILTKNNTILMQQRPKDWGKHAGVLNIFGGHLENDETPLQGLIRELREELGAHVKPQDVLFIGAITEDWTDHKEIVHVHFWHDIEGTITGCYEGETREYDTVQQALQHPKIMDYAVWALKQCFKKGLLAG